ncbi:MAG: hypothetical protein K2Q06_15375 [Parvularculaceae bacterium]|nr:hypothetical protein [Parvularculaceae bacterium]
MVGSRDRLQFHEFKAARKGAALRFPEARCRRRMGMMKESVWRSGSGGERLRLSPTRSAARWEKKMPEEPAPARAPYAPTLAYKAAAAALRFATPRDAAPKPKLKDEKTRLANACRASLLEAQSPCTD